jgi:hypothetical protein
MPVVQNRLHSYPYAIKRHIVPFVYSVVVVVPTAADRESNVRIWGIMCPRGRLCDRRSRARKMVYSESS